MTSKDPIVNKLTRRENLFHHKICEYLPESEDNDKKWCGLKLKDFDTVIKNQLILRLFHAAHEIHHREGHTTSPWEMYHAEAGPIYYVSCKCKKGVSTL
jgi:hypothetical protein